MSKIMKSIALLARSTMVDWRRDYAQTGKPIDMINQVSLLLVRSIMMSIFGEDLSDRKVLYKEKDQTRTVDIAFALRDNFLKLVTRQLTPQLVLFPDSYKWYFT